MSVDPCSLYIGEGRCGKAKDKETFAKMSNCGGRPLRVKKCLAGCLAPWLSKPDPKYFLKY